MNLEESIDITYHSRNRDFVAKLNLETWHWDLFHAIQ